MRTVLYTFLLLFSLSSCKEEAKTEEVIADVQTAPVSQALTDESAEANVANAPAPPPQQSQLKIIKTGNLRFETTNLEETAKQVTNAVKKYDALVQSDTQSNDGGLSGRYIVVRISPQYFESFVADISKGVKHFDRKDLTAEDVTEEYVDVEARIKAKQMLEARYFELLKKANKVSEMLEIEKELATIREEIESQQGRLKYLQNRVAQSTITIEFYKTQDVQVTGTEPYSSKMADAFKSGFNGLSSFFLGVLYMWPIILIFVIAYIIYRKKFKRKKNNA
jgi:hypothetical protein